MATRSGKENKGWANQQGQLTGKARWPTAYFVKTVNLEGSREGMAEEVLGLCLIPPDIDH